MPVSKKQSIQDAVKRAKPGTRIEVEGEHEEQVEIDKDGIYLIGVGKSAKLFPPKSYDEHNFCYGLSQDDTGKKTSAGICIHGRHIKLVEPYNPLEGHYKVESAGDPVKNVQVSNIEITGFDGQNVAIYGGKDIKISHNKLAKAGRYGLITAGSTGTIASKNIVIGSSPATIQPGSIAMCMDDFSSAEFSDNDISDYFIGLCTETNGGINKGNKVHDCCLGNIIDPGVKDAKTIDNSFSRWNPKCSAAAAAGVSILSSVNALVRGNSIDGMITGDATDKGAGLYLGDVFGVAARNTVKYNVFGKNDVDVFVDSDGLNDIRGNVCDEAYKNLTSGVIVPAPEFCKR
ncbi:hypothetical protein N0V94_003288 [Neodidymelliopsis sp. IMI 364377]|nr:hypothetical protein N0V94_003288 [Neodidymelliopsis sp. IMI 364377]